MSVLGRLARALTPDLPRPVRVIQAGALLNAVGNGVVLPFTMIYLHNVRGFSLGTAGLVVSTLAAVSLVATPVAGAAIDRLSARTLLGVSLGLLAGGYALLAFANEPWQAFVAMVVAGAGNGSFWPSQSTLLIGLTTREQRPVAMSFQRVAFNLGIGIGAGLGGLIARTSDVTTFQLLFLLNAASFVVYALALSLVPRPAPRVIDHTASKPRYREVLRDRVLLAVVGLNVVYVLAGYSLYEAALPLFAKNEAGVTERGIGLIFLANVVAIVLLQMPLTRMLEGRRRMTALAAMTLTWAAAWVIVLAGGAWFEAAAATAVFVLAAVVFGIGECVLAPAQSALVADLAPERLRGRYQALLTNSYAVGFVAGPTVAAVLLEASPAGTWLVGAAILVAAGAVALLVERWVPDEYRRAPARAPRAAAAAAVEAHSARAE